MTSTVKLDKSNRIGLRGDLLCAAGIPAEQTLKVSVTPGKIILEAQPARGRIVKLGKFSTWTGPVPPTPIEDAVEQIRHYEP